MQNISVEELKARLDAGEKINLIDVREPHEYAEFNLGAQLIPLGKIQTMQIDEIEDLKDERGSATGTKVNLKISFKEAIEEFA